MAAIARLARLEDEVRALRALFPVSPRPAQRRRVLGVAAAVTMVAFLVWSSFPSSRRTVMRTSAGDTVTLQFRTFVHDVEVRRTPDGEPLGLFGVPTSGARWATTATVLLPPSEIEDAGPTRLYLRYCAYGIVHDRVIDVEVRGERDTGTRAMLDTMPQSWVAFRRYDGRTLLYFTTLLAQKPALREIRWGLGNGPLDRTVRFTPSDTLGVSVEDEMFVVIPDQTDRLQVQLTYRDGSRSVVRTVLRRNAEIP